MFIGHFGVGFAVKKAAPALSLGLLFFAVQFLDLLWPTLLLLHIEHADINTGASPSTPLLFTDYPYSHSLAMVLLWSFLFGSIYWLFQKNRRNAVILFLCVLSHWMLDWLVHYPDLPLFPGSASRVGLGLWDRFVAENIAETVLFLVGFIIYLRATRATGKWGRFGPWVLAGLLVLTQAFNVFGPKPTDIKAVAWSAQMMWLLVLLAFWVDRWRVPSGAKVD